MQAADIQSVPAPGSTKNWNQNASWVGGNIPSSGDTVTINNSSIEVTDTQAAQSILLSYDFNLNSSELIIQPGGNLTVSDLYIGRLADGGRLILNGGTLSFVDGQRRIYASGDFGFSGLAEIILNGNTLENPTGELFMGQDLDYDGIGHGRATLDRGAGGLLDLGVLHLHNGNSVTQMPGDIIRYLEVATGNNPARPGQSVFSLSSDFSVETTVTIRNDGYIDLNGFDLTMNTFQWNVDNSASGFIRDGGGYTTTNVEVRGPNFPHSPADSITGSFSMLGADAVVLLGDNLDEMSGQFSLLDGATLDLNGYFLDLPRLTLGAIYTNVPSTFIRNGGYYLVDHLDVGNGNTLDYTPNDLVRTILSVSGSNSAFTLNKDLMMTNAGSSVYLNNGGELNLNGHNLEAKNLYYEHEVSQLNRGGGFFNLDTLVLKHGATMEILPGDDLNVSLWIQNTSDPADINSGVRSELTLQKPLTNLTGQVYVGEGGRLNLNGFAFETTGSLYFGSPGAPDYGLLERGGTGRFSTPTLVVGGQSQINLLPGDEVTGYLRVSGSSAQVTLDRDLNLGAGGNVDLDTGGTLDLNGNDLIASNNGLLRLGVANGNTTGTLLRTGGGNYRVTSLVVGGPNQINIQPGDEVTGYLRVYGSSAQVTLDRDLNLGANATVDLDTGGTLDLNGNDLIATDNGSLRLGAANGNTVGTFLRTGGGNYRVSSLDLRAGNNVDFLAGDEIQTSLYLSGDASTQTFTPSVNMNMTGAGGSIDLWNNAYLNLNAGREIQVNSDKGIRIGVGQTATPTELILGDSGGSANILLNTTTPGRTSYLQILSPGYGVLRGHGTVSLGGDILLQARLIADGFGYGDSVLNLYGNSALYSDRENTTNNGLFAVNQAKLILPPLTVTGDVTWGDQSTDTTPDMVNSVRFVWTGLSNGKVEGSLVAPDRSTVPSGLSGVVGVWEFTKADGLNFTSVEMTVRYDDVLAGSSESDLRLFHYTGGQWVDITGSLNTSDNTITGTASTFSYFAVAESGLDTGDDDNDGMPNWWEQEHFGGITAGVAGGHNDADSMTNLEEYQADTDPNDENSRLEVLDVRIVAGEAEVDWTAGTGAILKLYRNPSTGQPGDWVLVETLTPPTASTGTTTDATPGSAAWYRLTAERP